MFRPRAPLAVLSTAPPATLSFSLILTVELLGRRWNLPCLLTLCSIARTRRLALPLCVSWAARLASRHRNRPRCHLPPRRLAMTTAGHLAVAKLPQSIARPAFCYFRFPLTRWCSLFLWFCQAHTGAAGTRARRSVRAAATTITVGSRVGVVSALT